MNAAQSRKGRLRDVGILLLLITLHLGIVASVAFDERPVIWPLHNGALGAGPIFTPSTIMPQ